MDRLTQGRYYRVTSIEGGVAISPSSALRLRRALPAAGVCGLVGAVLVVISLRGGGTPDRATLGGGLLVLLAGVMVLAALRRVAARLVVEAGGRVRSGTDVLCESGAARGVSVEDHTDSDGGGTFAVYLRVAVPPGPDYSLLGKPREGSGSVELPAPYFSDLPSRAAADELARVLAGLLGLDVRPAE